jgi:iron complex transport system substrate-binding protein
MLNTKTSGGLRAPLSITRRAALGTIAAGLLVRPAAAEGEIRFKHVFGEAVLPGPAKRIVSLGYTTHDTLLALDVPPVALRYWFGDQPNGVWPWAQSHLAGTTPVIISGEAGAETIAALQPDLIIGIGSGISEAEYGVLSQIAPTLMQSEGRGTYDTSWDELARLLGRAVGKDALAEELIAGTKQRFADARARHPDWAGKRGVAVYHFGGDTGAFTSSDTRGRFIAELGFAPMPEVEKLGGGNFYASLSPEDLSPVDADLLIWISSYDSAPDLVALAMRRMLKAHREGREVFAGSLTAAALSFGSVLSLPYALEQLEADIAQAMDGDPATQVASAVKAGLAP